jgi:hypothetical protein
MKAIQPKLYTEGAERPETRAIRRPHRHASWCLRDAVRRPRSEVRGARARPGDNPMSPRCEDLLGSA